MCRWSFRAALMVVFSVVIGMVAVLPAATGIAEPARPYRQTVPLVAGDSASGSATGNPNSAAGTLVAAVTSASTDGARLAALEQTFDALHIGVYNGDGTAIVSGAETSSQDFYFYTTELETMAASLGRADRWSFDDLAATLNAPGVFAGGFVVDAAELQQAVAKTIGDAQAHASDAAWLSPLLVEELGLKHTPADDLTGGPVTSTANLDALQRALILTDLLIGLPRSSAEVAARSTLAADSNGILQQSPVTAQGACGDFHGSEAVRNIGKFAAGFVEIAGKAIQVITLPLDMSHGISLALGVKVEALADNLKTHYGHENAGAPLEFPVRVRMLDEVTQAQIDCGWMAGITYPKQGPIPNIKIQWDSGALESHGKTTCDSTCQQTGEDGIATLVFQPKQEQSPYDGRLTSEKGRVEANALYLTSLGNMFGAINEVVTPKMADFVWEVEWHAKGTWEGQVTTTWDDEGQVAKGTTDVKFELGLAAPGEGETHTNIYQLTQGSSQWSQTLEDCVPAPKTGTTALDPGSAALTVTEADGMMTYEFATLSGKTVPYSVVCGDDPPQTVPVAAFPPEFPFPMAGPEDPHYKSGSMPIGDTISGSTTLVIDGASVSWTWKLTRK